MRVLALAAITIGLEACCCCSCLPDMPDAVGDKLGEKLSEEIAERAVEQGLGKGIELDVDGDEVRIRSDDGTLEITSGDAALPPDFPVKLHPSGHTVGSYRLPGDDGGEVIVLAQELTVSGDEAETWYGDQLKAAGFRETHDITIAEQATRAGAHAFVREPWVVMVAVVTDDDGKVTASVFAGREAKPPAEAP